MRATLALNGLKGTEIQLKSSYGYQNSLLQPLLPQWHDMENLTQNDIQRILKKYMQIINTNKRFTAFATMIKHEKHVIDKEQTILRTLVISFAV